MLSKLVTKILPYWCKYCPKRYMRLRRYHRHFLLCEGRKRTMLREQEVLGAVAPVNRHQRRQMAKKMGGIKEWKNING